MQPNPRLFLLKHFPDTICCLLSTVRVAANQDLCESELHPSVKATLMQVRWEKQVDAMAAGLKTTSEAFERDTALTLEEEPATGGCHSKQACRAPAKYRITVYRQPKWTS